MAAVGFEPTPPKRLVPKTSALDRSATLPGITNNNSPIQISERVLDYAINKPFFYLNIALVKKGCRFFLSTAPGSASSLSNRHQSTWTGRGQLI